MAQHDAATAEPTATPFESIGMLLARASFVALIVGLLEGVIVARLADTPVSGIGLATAGLWLPGAVLAIIIGLGVRRAAQGGGRRNIGLAVLAAMVVAIAAARVLSSAPVSVRAAPIEIVAAIALGWVSCELEVAEALRRPIAIAGIVIAVGLQLYATRWVDAHRAFAGLLADKTMIPRVMLKYVLRRFV